jgi:hypothetical protein
MAAYNIVPGSREALAEVVNAGTDQWAIALSNAAPTATAFVAGTTDLATGGGYTQGGVAVSTLSSSESADVYRLVLSSPPTFAPASGDSIGPLQYVLLVNTTNSLTMGYWALPSPITINGTAGDVFTAALNGTDGAIRI